MTALRVHVCAACGRAWFPRRLLCPACGGGEWNERETTGGVVEVATELRRVPGADVSVGIASVRLDEGPVVVARLDGAATGARVGVGSENGAPVARPA